MPRVVILDRINGAGKTTASRAVLQNVLRIPTFVNADAIARGLNGLNPEAESMRAGRLVLEELDRLVEARADFAFETTLAARTYAPFLGTLRVLGYEVYLYYYWLRSADLAVSRVADRVKAGGHHVPEKEIRRRYTRSVRNFIELCRPVAHFWEVYDNTDYDRRLLAMGEHGEELVDDETVWERFIRSADHAGNANRDDG